MKKFPGISIILFFILFLMTGCTSIGDKETSISVIYGATTIISLLLLVAYCVFIKNKNKWFFLLFSSVLVVNIGYYLLSVSTTLNEALWANRVAYLGSVFLPLSMLMIILFAINVNTGKLLPATLTAISIIVFLIAASPGYLDIYYKSVSLEVINGIAVLSKEYGSWHSIYLFYLLAYLVAMFSIISYASIKKKIETASQSVILFFAVLVNVAVWFLEQLVEINFEILSVSYIITEVFLLSLFMMIQSTPKNAAVVAANTASDNNTAISSSEASAKFVPTAEQCEYFISGIRELTQTEKIIYNFYTEGKSSKEIMGELNIKENTLKYHNKNIYSKLGISSRKQLLEIAKKIAKENKII